MWLWFCSIDQFRSFNPRISSHWHESILLFVSCTSYLISARLGCGSWLAEVDLSIPDNMSLPSAQNMTSTFKVKISFRNWGSCWKNKDHWLPHALRGLVSLFHLFQGLLTSVRVQSCSQLPEVVCSFQCHLVGGGVDSSMPKISILFPETHRSGRPIACVITPCELHSSKYILIRYFKESLAPCDWPKKWGLWEILAKRIQSHLFPFPGKWWNHLATGWEWRGDRTGCDGICV